MTTRESTVARLTSAEAGFLYAGGRCGRLFAAREMVDEVMTPTLAEACEAVEDEDWEELSRCLEASGFQSWWRRGAAGACEDRRSVMQWALEVLEDADSDRDVEAVAARRQLGRVLCHLGGDLSPDSEDHFDLRRWLRWEERQKVGARLVILGGVLVGALKKAVIRRRVASLLRQLPPLVRRRVRQGLEAVSPLDNAVERRVYEVYRRMADRPYRADEELAMVGLYFAINACVFRQNGVLDRLKQMLPERMSSQCRLFRSACVQSRKPELSTAVAHTLNDAMGAIEDESSQEGEDDDG